MENPSGLRCRISRGARALIPLIDLKQAHRHLADEILGVIREIVLDGAFVGGTHVQSFEREGADFCGTGDAVGVASATDAIRLLLIAAGIRQADEVVTVPFTFAATLEAIIQAGARPVLVDGEARGAPTGAGEPGIGTAVHYAQPVPRRNHSGFSDTAQGISL